MVGTVSIPCSDCSHHTAEFHQTRAQQECPQMWNDSYPIAYRYSHTWRNQIVDPGKRQALLTPSAAGAAAALLSAP